MKKELSYHQPLYLDSYYHIYNRAVGKEKLFYKDINYSYFLNKFKYYLRQYVDVFSYCLLPNHFHFLIKVKENNPQIVSKHFRRLFISYSMSINKQENRTGNLFIKNFKRRLIDDENYLISVIRYSHLNPVHHKLKSDYGNYSYSSYRTIISNSTTTLKRENVLGWFSGKERFIEFHEEGKERIVENFYNFEGN